MRCLSRMLRDPQQGAGAELVSPRSRRRLAVALAAALLGLVAAAPNARAAPCDTPANEIVAENCNAGTPSGDWEISGAGNQDIQGFATDISVDQGETVALQDRHRRDATTGSTSTGSATTAASARGIVATVEPAVAAPEPAGVPDEAAHRPGRLRQLERLGDVDRPGRRDLGHLLRARSCASTARRREPHRLRRARRRRPLGPALPDLRHDLAGLQPATAATASTSGSPAGRAYKVTYNRPFTTRGRHAPRTGCSTPSTR